MKTNHTLKITPIHRSSKSGFTLVELLVVVAILAFLGGGVYWGVQRAQEGTMNRKVIADLSVIASAIEQYKADHNRYPDPLAIPMGERTLLCFKVDASYEHDCPKAAFVQTTLDSQLLGENYLKDLPSDPRSGSAYAYGVTNDGRYFQLAGNLWGKGDTWTAEVRGNLDGAYQLSSLIRSFDGPNFVLDEEGYLPYSPTPLSFAATARNIKGAVMAEGQKLSEGETVEAGQTIETGQDASATLYFPDGSVTYMDSETHLVLSPASSVAVDEDGESVTRVQLGLPQGKIWNKVARLVSKSRFNVETTSAIAGVRGTEFGLEADSSELILKSGTVAVMQKEEGADEAAYQQFDLDLFSSDQDAVNETGKYTRFKIPAYGGAMVEGEVVQDEALIKEWDGKYYRSAFTNNIKPRLWGINTEDDSDLLVFVLVGSTQKIHAVNKNDDNAIVHTWELNDIVFDWDNMRMTIDPTPVYGMDSVKFRFEDGEGNMTSAPNPALQFGKGVSLSQSVLYNYVALSDEIPQANEDNEQLPQEGPSIVNAPQNMALSSQAQLLSASMPCDWTIEPASSGALVGNANDSDAVQYKPLNDSLQANALQANVANRFDNSSTEPVTVRCTNPNDPNQFDEKVITLNYGAFKSSDLSNYEYSYKAQGNVSWNIAKSTCAGLQEGGHSDWKLPEKAVYEGLNIATEKLNLCDFNGQTCEDLGGVFVFNFDESQNLNSGWSMSLVAPNNFTGTTKANQFPFLGFRCVR